MILIHNDFKIDFMLNMLKDLKENTNNETKICTFIILVCFNTFTYTLCVCV